MSYTNLVEYSLLIESWIHYFPLLKLLDFTDRVAMSDEEPYLNLNFYPYTLFKASTFEVWLDTALFVNGME